jgi:hypothetical protein
MVRDALRRGALSMDRSPATAHTTHRTKRCRDFRDQLPRRLSGLLIDAGKRQAARGSVILRRQTRRNPACAQDDSLAGVAGGLTARCIGQG